MLDPKKLYDAIFSSETGTLIACILLAVAAPVMLFVLPLYSRAAVLRLRKMRDEHIAQSMQDIPCRADLSLASRALFRALLMYAAFWLLFALFLSFGVGAYMVLAIPGHTLTFLATRSLASDWRDLELSPSRFRLIYLGLVAVTPVPGIVLFVLRYSA